MDGRIANNVGDILLIKLTSPYVDVENILSYEDVVNGENTANYFYKYFRWSIDNESYSDWEFLTNENLVVLTLDSSNEFWIQYKYEVEALESGNELEFISISLEIVTVEGNIVEMPCLEYCGDGECAPNENLIISDCCEDDVFKPYDMLDQGKKNLEQLSCLVSDLFGHTVNYYKHDPRSDSEDVILKEYSLYNVRSVENLKIVLPDNEFPTREIAFSPDGLLSPDMFEVHIVKTHFQTVFGTGTRPGERDYLYFPEIERVFEINSIAEADESLNASTYYRVMLTDYQDRKDRYYDDAPEAIEEIDEITVSSNDVFGEETVAEEAVARKPEQYNTISAGDSDYLRDQIDPNLIISEEKIRNNFTVISKNYYKLNSVTRDQDVVIYKYNKGFTTMENRAFTFWVRPHIVNSYSYSLITEINQTTDGNTEFTLANHGYSVGDIIRIKGTIDYNGVHTVSSVNSDSYVINTIYISGEVSNGKSKMYEQCKYFNYGNTDFAVTLIIDALIITVAGNNFVFDLSLEGKTFTNENWYGIVINLSNTFKQLSAFVWNIDKITGSPQFNKGSEMVNMYNKTISLTETYSVADSLNWKIVSCNIDLTNIRIFTVPIEIEEQSLVLSQYVVKDSHLHVLVDNGIPGIRLLKRTEVR